MSDSLKLEAPIGELSEELGDECLERPFGKICGQVSGPYSCH